MKYNHETGKIFDTIGFFIEYFDKSTSDGSFFEVHEDGGFMGEFAQLLKEENLEIPDYLSPLFIRRDDPNRPIPRLFVENCDLWSDNIDSFTARLTAIPDVLYKYAYEFIFGEGQMSENYIDALNRLDAPVEYKLQASMLLGNFSYAMSVLADLMKRVYRLVDVLHERHADELAEKFYGIDLAENRLSYLRMMKLNELDFDRLTVSVCLLFRELIYVYSRGEDVFLLLGYYCREGIENRANEPGITVENFIICCGNKLRLKILRAVAENGELTSSQIAGVLRCPVTTTIRHMELLSSNGLIKVTKRQGLSIFYGVNVKLFKKMQKEVYNLFEKVIGDEEK